MINAKRLLGIPAATGVAVIGKAEAPNPVIDWNDTAITTALAANQVTFARLKPAKGENNEQETVVETLRAVCWCCCLSH